MLNGSRRRSIISATAAIAVVAATGCALIANIGDDEELYPSDASAGTEDSKASSTCGEADVQTDTNNCGHCGTACAANHTCAGGSCLPTCKLNVYYVQADVAPDGSGCSTKDPATSISTAVAAVVAANGSQAEIHVCRGDYAEGAAVREYGQASLLGSYDCQTWARTPTYGYPTFDGTNTTTLRLTSFPSGGDQPATSGTLEIDETSVDGFRIEGFPYEESGSADDGGAASSVAVNVQYGGPTLTNNMILGASPSTNAEAISLGTTIALYVGGSANPEIANNVINGGVGTSGSSALVFETGTAPNVHDNRILTGDSDNGTVIGISAGVTGGTLASAGPLVERNVIQPGRGCTSRGIEVLSSGMRILGNTIQVSSFDCSDSNGIAAGISFVGNPTASNQTLTIAGNRVAAIAAGSHAAISIGVSAEPSPLLLNNALAAQSETGSSEGLHVSGAPGAQIEANTIYAQVAIALSPGAASAMTIVDNLLLGDLSNGSAAIVNGICGSTPTWQNNAFAVEAVLALAQSGATDSDGGCTLAPFTSIDALQADVTGASNNVLAAADCDDASSSCAIVGACAGMSMASCLLPAILPSWSANGLFDGGAGVAFASLFSPGGWALGDAGPCSIVAGGRSLGGATDDSGMSPAVDITGAPRNATQPTIGAYEVVTSPCRNP